MPGLRWLTTLGALLALGGAAHAADGPCKAPQPCVIVRTDKTCVGSEPRCEVTQAIEKRLLAPVSLNFKGMPLGTVIETLREMTNMNVVADIDALKTAGVSLQQPLTLKVHLPLGSALRILLKQAQLTYVVRDDALQITTEEGAKGKLQTVTYNVADLIVPIGSGENELAPFICRASKLIGAPGAPESQHTPGLTAEDLLMRLITERIAPESWANRGGKGTLQYFPLGLSLVATQTADVQEQIAEFLAELRRLQDREDKEFTLETRIIDGKPGDEDIMQLPRITFVRGQPINVSVNDTVTVRYGEGMEAPVNVGLVLRAKVTKAEGGRLRLDVTLQQQKLVQPTSEGGFQLRERAHRVVQCVEPGKSVKVGLSWADRLEPCSWLILTLNEVDWTGPTKPPLSPQSTAAPCGDKDLVPVSTQPVVSCPGSR
jgi:hypothetical protein